MRKKTTLPRSRGRVTRALKKRRAKTAAIARRAAGRAVVVPLADQVDVAMHRLPVDSIKLGQRHRKDFGDLDALATSINDRGGLIHPIAVTPQNVLIAGERRLRAWKLSKFAKLSIPAHVIDIDSIVAGEWDENAPGIRKNFTLEEAVEIKRAIEPREKAAAAERMKAGKAVEGAKAERAGDKVARMVGIDRRTLDKAEAVVEAARAEPEKYAALLDQMNRTGRAHGPHKRLVNIRQADQIRAEPPPLPGRGPYRAGVIDLPWASEPDGESPSATGRGYYQYPTMNTPEMIEFGDKVIPLLDPRGGHIWFWVTNFHLLGGHAFGVLDAWSAKAEAAGCGPIRRIGKRTWVKDVMGRGQVFRGQTEDVILCAFGKSPPALGEVLSTRLDGPVRRDSQKPDRFYSDVEAATPAPRYFELFARRKMPDNWDGFGDQVGTLGEAIAEAAAVDVLAWRKPHQVKAPRALFNGEETIAGNFLAIIAAKAAAGEIAWRDDDRKGESIGKVAWFGKADFRNCEFGTWPAPRGFVGGVSLYRKGRRVDVGHYNNERGTGFGYSCMPIGKVKKFLSAWSKAETQAPAIEPDKPRRGKQSRKPPAADGQQLDIVDMANRAGQAEARA